jgi:16S rRNA processing protein RimM
VRPERWIELGRVSAPFGVRGWVRVRSFTEPPEELLRLGRWSLRVGEQGRLERRVLEGRRHGSSLVARLEGVEGRSAAAALRGAAIEVVRDALPPPGDRQFYQVDLIGLTVSNLEGIELGRVLHFLEAPGNAVMVVRGEREHWVPATPRHVRSVDLAAGRIVVDWPAVLE